MKRKSGQVGKSGALTTKEKRPRDWSVEAQLVALHETHGLAGEALHAWCRENGLFAHHLTNWKMAFCADAKAAPGTREMRVLKDENDQLKRELVRKEKALAEAAALLILQEKFRALWEDEVKWPVSQSAAKSSCWCQKRWLRAHVRHVPVRQFR